MNYRERIYSKYRSSHIKNLIGNVDLNFFKEQFPVWNKYYGEFLPKDKNVKDFRYSMRRRRYSLLASIYGL